jgi:hypothetical protein
MLINSESTSSLVKFGGKQNFVPLSQITEDPVPPNILDKSSTLKLPDTNKIESHEEEGMNNRSISSKKLTSQEPIINTLNQNNDYN